ncbi:hydantoinase B/oxoprolinase family protein [Kineobactrum salinum]|uniref:Hydantoinase B/oxoprolinase family protein n=1 Tax=Kineobactrum salinum TaxID=2708301 RepID=A0A6C0U900_9GAMM|nr:hydantoinase B/oxoprolinase family protein [Kineobactrum salinum]QIB66064.1 hydantoinase B/oxoprolinase family protein [Kineobactrum salinum]
MQTTSYGRDHEIVQHLRPEPMTDVERAGEALVDDVEFEIFKHKMHMIGLEGKENTMRLGASTAMRFGDVAFGIFTAQGDLAICATGIYHHAVLGQLPLKYIVKHWVNEPSVGVRDGDSFFYNDPFYGGVHNADMGLAVPVFHEGRLLCFVGAAVHTGECGGSEPGGTVTAARSKYDEGLLCPPIKVGENYQLKEDLLTMFAAMNRDPRTMILDIKARLAATRIAQRRILEVVENKGVDFFLGALRKVLTVTGEAAKKKVAALNDGIYRQPRFLDTLGEENGLLKVDLTVIKKGDTITLNLENSSPLVPDTPANSYFQGIIGLSMVYFCGWLFHDLPPNNGLLEAVDWKFPDDSFVNAKGDVATSIAPLVQICFTHGMFQCGARMTYSSDPSRSVASWFSGFSIPMFAGINQHGEPVADITPEINATGCGARYDMDGVNAAGAFFATMADCSDVETTEANNPILYSFRNYFNNSYGHGKYRGGAGLGYGLIVHDTNQFMLGSHGGGSKFPTTQGLFGGYGLPCLFLRKVGGSNFKERLAASDDALPRNLTEVFDATNPERGEVTQSNISSVVERVQDGDTMYAYAGGGAGYGDALEREPEGVLRDLADGLVSHWAAENIYYLVYDRESLLLDTEATLRRRQEVREQRLQRGKPWAEFEAEWLQQRPPAKVLQYYGEFPVPQTFASEGGTPSPQRLAS